MNDYIEFYLQSVMAYGTPESFVSLFFLGLARVLPIIALAPYFGSRTLPLPVKVGFGISLLVILFPAMVLNMTAPVYFNTQLLLLAAKEVFVGFSLGLIMAAPFFIVQSVGMIIDHQRGGASLQVNDPTQQSQSSPLGTLYNLILITLFYLVDGPFYFLDVVASTYHILPPDHLLPGGFFSEDTQFWKLMISFLNKIMVLTVQLVAPPLIMTLMTDMFLGIVNRLAPQVQIIFLGMPLKSLLALLVVFLGWKAYNEETIVVAFQWIDYLKEAVLSFAQGRALTS